MDEPAASLARAAREVFARYGVARATMSDVAKAAGVVRQTVYNTVTGRDHLIELAIVQCCEELQERLDAATAEDPDDLDEALLAFLCRAVEMTAAHGELADLMAALPEDRVREIFGQSHPVEELIKASLRPLLERALADSRLRPGVTIEDTSRWLQGVLTFALLQEAADPETRRRHLRTFALPSVLVPGAKGAYS
ncbi:TetR/AcrR family transcriptional regulator [Nocardioides humilatus]|uniref:TetR/AcrR family transcriptional regulator n=1 Tax=Nocardioides humilatus TaxID=2607660 RepID=A0A5B1LM46_9ACTN|nr:TetR/AcrR family transcriptional regulator [Nocardioides humilatus]KAA1421855.1 TetR/AcrR family transcriptional regulator [Nocardioides humilatus]